MLLDAEERQDGWFKDTIFDVCICGAGPAGITLAVALAARGRRVALMEAGGLEVTTESQDLYRGESVGLPYFPLDACRLRYLGGSSNHWGGYTRPLDARDFAPLSGVSSGGWPVAKAELDAHAEHTAEILDLPSPATPLDIFAGKEELLEPGIYRVSPVQFGAKYRDELTRSSLVSLLLNANLVNVELRENLRSVAAMRFRAYTRDEAFAVNARHYAICCGALENARILLNANRQLPNGIGNQHDQVGRYFCEHVEVGVGRAVLAQPLADEAFYFATDRLIAERKCQSFEITLLPLERNAASCALPFAERLAEALRNPGSACFDASISAVIGQATIPESRVRLANTADRFGLRQLALDWRLADADGQTLRIAAEEFGRALARHDVGRLRLDPWVTQPDAGLPISNEQGGSSHHMCTTRMGNDPRTGVVDRDCRVHGLENLYIGGSSVFASPGVSNPTFTIVQLALRLADQIEARLVER